MSDFELADKYFPVEGSSVPELPAEDVSEEQWAEWADDYEAALAEQQEFEEQEWELSPGDYPELDRSALSPEGNAYADQVMLEAAQQAREQDYQGGLYARVEALAGEFDLRGEPLQAAAQAVDGALREVFYGWLAAGYDPGQASAALQDSDIDGAIRQALVYQRHLKVTENTSLGQWRQGREADARAAALLGQPAKPDIMAHPSIQRMGARIAAHEARQKGWEQGVRASYERQTRGY